MSANYIKTIYIYCLLTSVFMLGLGGHNALAQQLVAPLMDDANPVSVDDTFTSSEWLNAGATETIYPGALLDSDGVGRDVTVYALHNNQNLYLGFIVKDEAREDTSIGTYNDDGIVLLFESDAQGDTSIEVDEDFAYSYFVVPDTSTADVNDVTVSGNKHVPSTDTANTWDTTAGLPVGVNAQFSNIHDGSERGWQMEILIPFDELNNIDPNPQNANAITIGFAFFIINDYGDKNGSFDIDDGDNDGYLASPLNLAGTYVSPPTPVITPSQSVDTLLNNAVLAFTNPAAWEHSGQPGIRFERPNIHLNTTTFNFSSIHIGDPVYRTLTVENDGNESTTLKYTLPTFSPASPYRYSSDDGRTPGTEISLAFGAAPHEYQIECRPMSEGNFDQTVEITSNDENKELSLKCVGQANMLVVRVEFNDLGTAPSQSEVEALFDNAETYFNHISYGKELIHETYFDGPIDGGSRDSYLPENGGHPLIDLVQYIMPNIKGKLDPDPGATTDDIKRLLIVTNDPNFADDVQGSWASIGLLDKELINAGLADADKLKHSISISVHSAPNGELIEQAKFNNGIANQLKLKDLYNYPSVDFGGVARADNWTNMATPLKNQNVLVSNKIEAGWIVKNSSDIEYIPRPEGSITETYGLSYQADNVSGRPKAILVGFTPCNLPNPQDCIVNEKSYFLIEARDKRVGTYDENIPETGVIVYRVDEERESGEGPVRIININDALEAGDPALPNVDGSGLTVSVEAPSDPLDAYDILINYNPPEHDNDIEITKGNPAHISPDIWIDSMDKDGKFDEDASGAPNPNSTDGFIEGETNRLYYRLQNNGPGDAFDVEVDVRISEPYHTVGDVADFNRVLDLISIERIGHDMNQTSEAGCRINCPASGECERGASAAPGREGEAICFIEWEPEEDNNSKTHSCALVTVRPVLHETNPNNNTAQQNLGEDQTTQGSPYDEVVHHYSLTNPYDVGTLFYFQVKGIPSTWDVTYSPRKEFLAPGETVEARVIIQPSDTEPPCDDFLLTIESWAARDDSLVKVGGAILNLGLRQRTTLTATTTVGACNEDPIGHNQQLEQYASLTMMAANPMAAVIYNPGKYQPKKECASVTVQGCTSPPKRNEEIVVRYEDPSGNPIYKVVTTDANGCYQDLLEIYEGGDWEVTAEYPGKDCSGSAKAGPLGLYVGIQITGDHDGDGVKDEDEHQSDADGDGFYCVMDRDCDNDGVLDGDEPYGDFDGDGFINVIDPDSDGDGTPDGQDKTPWGDFFCTRCEPNEKWSFTGYLGITSPGSGLNLVADDAFTISGQFDYRLNPSWSLGVLLAHDRFDDTVGLSDPHFTHISPQVRYHFPSNASCWNPYLVGGLGIYRDNNSNNDIGYNVGLGVTRCITNTIGLDGRYDFHSVDGGKFEYQTLRVGLRWLF